MARIGPSRPDAASGVKQPFLKCCDLFSLGSEAALAAGCDDGPNTNVVAVDARQIVH